MKFSESITLAKTSGQILRDNKQLAVVPSMIFICEVIILIGSTYAYYLIGDSQAIDAGIAGSTALGVSVAILTAMLLGFASTFGEAVVSAQTLNIIRQKHSGLKTAFMSAASRSKPLFIFAALNVFIGLLIEYLVERLPFAGKIIAILFGASWSVASMFAVINALETGEVNPIKNTKASALILRKSYGENIVASTGIALTAGLVMIMWIILSGFLTTLVGSLFLSGAALILSSFAIVLTGLIALMVIFSTLNKILKVCVYEYTTTGKEVGNFNKEMFKTMITKKRAMSIFG